MNTPDRARARLDLLVRASTALLDADDPAQVLEPILADGRDVLGIDQSYTYEVTEDGCHLHLVYSVGADAATQRVLDHVSFSVPLCGIVAQTGRELVIPDIQETVEPRYAIARELGQQAYAGFPVKAGGDLVGVISFGSERTTSFDGDTLEFFGTIARFLSIAMQRRRTEDERKVALASKAVDHDRLWSITRDPLAISDLEGRLIAVNPAWTALLGWEAEEVLGRTSEWLEHPDDREKTRTETVNLAGGEPSLAFEHRLRTKAGDYRTLSWACVPEGDRIYCSARDVTDQRRTEETLRQSQKMEAIGQLTGGIAHDFNNMLTGVIGAMDIMKRRLATGRTDDLERFMDAAAQSAQRAAALTARLLAFSRRQSLDARPVNVAGLLGGLHDLLLRSIRENIALEIVPEAAPLPLVVADANQLESAILNLVINARDAMPDGGQLTIETTPVHLDKAYAAAKPDVVPGDYVMIAVSDTGVGMSADTLARVFEPFFSTKPTGQGTGLGLSMVYGFARQSRGQVRIHSEAGQGTSVKLYLPVADGGATEAKADTPVTFEGDGEVVLLVEDDPSVRLLVREVLEELRYRTLEADSADTALPIIRSDQRIDLLVSDVGLPGMSGRELADHARERRPELPVLFVTGYAENAAIRAGFLGTGMAMITKPFAIEALSAKIAEMMPCKR